FLARAIDETQMSRTRNVVLGGSPTARIQQEVQALSGAGEIIHDAITGNHAGLLGKTLRAMGFGQVSDETLDELAKLLLTRPEARSIERLASLSAQQPGRPISQGTQLLTGASTGAVGGGVAGRSIDEERRRRARAARLARTQ